MARANHLLTGAGFSQEQDVDRAVGDPAGAGDERTHGGVAAGDSVERARRGGEPVQVAASVFGGAATDPNSAAPSWAIWLDVNGARHQSGDLVQMIWEVPEMISYLPDLFTLKPGDLIFTGTPSGVGAVHRGDWLNGHIDRAGDIEIVVV